MSLWLRLPRNIRSLIRYPLERIFSCEISSTRRLVKGDIVVGGFMGSIGGIGQGARCMLDFFKASALPAYGANFSKSSVGSENFDGGPLWPPQAGKGGIIIIHMNPNLFPLGAFKSLGKARLLPRRIVGYWYWELDTVPQSWKKALNAVDEIWAPSHFVANALRKIAPQKAIHVVPCLVDVESPLSAPIKDPFPQLAGRVIVFFMYDVASTHARKNPCAVIEAFKKASAGNADASLVIKISNSHFWPQSIEMVQKAAEGADNITIIQEKLSAGMMKDLWARIDIAISLHRSEGFGFFMAEAMAAGKPVIATGWSSNTDYMTQESSALVNYTLVDVEDPQHIYDQYNARWAEPDVNHAAEILRGLLNNPAERQRLGKAARAHIEQYLSRRNCLDLLPESFWQSLEDETWRDKLSEPLRRQH